MLCRRRKDERQPCSNLFDCLPIRSTVSIGSRNFSAAKTCFHCAWRCGGGRSPPGWLPGWPQMYLSLSLSIGNNHSFIPPPFTHLLRLLPQRLTMVSYGSSETLAGGQAPARSIKCRGRKRSSAAMFYVGYKSPNPILET